MNETDMKPSKFLNTLSYGAERPARYGKSPKALAAFLVGFIFLSISPAFSAPFESVPDLPPGTVVSKDPIFFDAVSPGMNLVLHDRYKEGLLVFEEIQKTYPDHPAPHFFKAAAYQSYMSSFRLNRFQKELEENVQLAIAKGNKLLESKNDPWLHFYVGGAYGYRAFNRFRKHNWIGLC